MTAAMTKAPCSALGCDNEVDAVAIGYNGVDTDEHGGVSTVRKTMAVGGMCESCAAEDGRRELERKQEATTERLRRSSLPRALWQATGSTMDREHGRGAVIDEVKEWATAHRPAGMCLFGPVGAGKTRLAAAAAVALLRRRPVRWTSVPVLLASVGAAFNDEGRAAAISTITGNGALFLDDLDKLNPTDWSKTQLFAAIDSRIQAGAPLFVTTNLPPGGIADTLGDPIASRIAGYCRVLELRTKSDYRLANKGVA